VENVRISAIKSRAFRARRQLASLVDARDVIHAYFFQPVVPPKSGRTDYI
jgi:hypothetical protein